MVTWSCQTVEKLAKKKWLRTPKGRLSNKQSDWKKRNGFNLPAEIIEQFKNATHCQCCGEPRSYNKPNHFCIDHCHENNSIRGFICYRCNVGIGMFDNSTDKLHKVIEYLKKFKKTIDMPSQSVNLVTHDENKQ